MEALRFPATDQAEPDVATVGQLIEPLDVLLRLQQDEHLDVGLRHILALPGSEGQRDLLQVGAEVEIVRRRDDPLALGALPVIDVGDELVTACAARAQPLTAG